MTQQLEKCTEVMKCSNTERMAEGEGIWLMLILTDERSDSSHTAFVDTIWLIWNLPVLNQTRPNGKCKWVASYLLIQTKWTELQVWKHPQVMEE